ncbi:MAG: hypothetical protein IJJ33_06665 [Victivallales bacterium]|nr:hypothetical protein [Victivallales bacterium]
MKKKAESKEQRPSLVWAEPEQGRAFIGRMAENPEAAVAKLAACLKEANDSPTVVASFALEGLVHRSLEPGQDTLRTALATALAEQLPKAADAAARCILLHFLQLLAVPSTVSAIAEWLDGEPQERTAALGALESIDTGEAYEAIWSAAWRTPSRLARAELLAVALAFATVDQEHLDRALQFAGKRCDAAARMVWPGLATQGALKLLPILFEASGSPKCEVAGTARRAFLTILKQLPDAEIRRQTALCQQGRRIAPAALRDLCILECKNWALSFHKRYGGVQGMEALLLAFGECDESFLHLMRELGSADSVLRATAMGRLSTGFADTEFTQRMMAAMKPGRRFARQRAALIKVLGNRGDAMVRPCVNAALSDSEAEVRAAAVEAVAKFPSTYADGQLLSALACAIEDLRGQP